MTDGTEGFVFRRNSSGVNYNLVVIHFNIDHALVSLSGHSYQDTFNLIEASRKLQWVHRFNPT